MENKKRAMLLHEEDNVIIAIETIEPGETADAGSVKVTVNETIERMLDYAEGELTNAELVGDYSWTIPHVTNASITVVEYDNETCEVKFLQVGFDGHLADMVTEFVIE